MTQAAVAALTGVSERHYRNLEEGGPGNFSTTFLQSVSRVLGLDEDQVAALYTAHGHEPPQRMQDPEVDAPLVQLLHEQCHGAYVSDAAWDVLAYNEHAARHYPWMTQPGCNVMGWALSKDAQYQLHDWLDAWARPMLAQLRMAMVRWPDNLRLKEVADQVRENPDIDELWRTEPSAQVQPYGDVRPMWLPTYRTDRPILMRVMAFAPLRDTALRLIIMMPAEPVDENA